MATNAETHFEVALSYTPRGQFVRANVTGARRWLIETTELVPSCVEGREHDYRYMPNGAVLHCPECGWSVREPL